MPGKRLRYQPPHSAAQNRAPSPAAPSAHPWFSMRNLAEPGKAEIKLYGYIGEPTEYRDWWTGEMVENPDGAGTLQEFAAALEALGPVDEIQVSIFSHGGDVYVGSGMHNLLVRHPAHKIAIIDGLCASAATYPAMACHEIRIPSNAWMMIHEATNYAWGKAGDLRAEADRLDATNQNIAGLYASRAGKTVEEMMSLMNAAEYLSGEKAVEIGLADTVIAPMPNLASRAASLAPTNCSRLDQAPADVLAFFDMRGWVSTPSQRPINKTVSSMNPPTSTPALAPAPAAPPANQPADAAPAAPANAAPAPAPAPAPVAAPEATPAPTPANAAPTPFNAADLTAVIQGAVTNAVKPLQDRLEIIESQHKAGVTPANLGGAQPVPNVTPTNDGARGPINFDLPAGNLINLGRRAVMERGATTPPQ